MAESPLNQSFDADQGPLLSASAAGSPVNDQQMDLPPLDSTHMPLNLEGALSLDDIDPRSKNPGAIPLLGLSAVCAQTIIHISPSAPLYVVMPFVFTFVGSFVGFLVEAFGATVGNFGAISQFRVANLGFVLPSMLVMCIFLGVDELGSYALVTTLVAFTSGVMVVHGGLGYEPWLSKFLVYANLLTTLFFIFTGTSPVLDDPMDSSLPPLFSVVVDNRALTHRTALVLAFVVITVAFAVGDLIQLGALLSMKWFSLVFHSLLLVALYILKLVCSSAPMLGWWVQADGVAYAAALEEDGAVPRIFFRSVPLPLPPQTVALCDFQTTTRFILSVVSDLMTGVICFLGRVFLDVESWQVCDKDFVVDAVLPASTGGSTGAAYQTLLDNYGISFGAFIAGALFILWLIPNNWSIVRYKIVGFMWTLIHRGLLSTGAGPPPPITLRVDDPESIAFVPYLFKHVLSRPLQILAAKRIPAAQAGGVQSLEVLFGILSFLDDYVPMARSGMLPSKKPRLAPDLGVDYYWPAKILNYPAPIAPPYVQTFGSCPGRLLAWVLNYGTGGRELHRRDDQNGKYFDAAAAACGEMPAVMLDLTRLERYNVKAGFAPVGGRAFFRANKINIQKKHVLPQFHGVPDCEIHADDAEELELLCMYRPGDTEDLKYPFVTSRDLNTTRRNEFQHIERVLFAGLTTLNVVIYHLLEIHCLTSAIATAIHNAFDARHNDKPHALRAVLQFHFSNSVAVQEMTTAHLLDRKAVFAQVFSFEHTELARFLDDAYMDYVFLRDTDLDERARTIATPQVVWESVYENSVWAPYTQEVVALIYGENDVDASTAIAEDVTVQRLFHELKAITPTQELPAIYEGLGTAQGLRHLLTHLLHLVTVRHEILGTTVPLSILDHRFTGGVTQQVADGSPLPLEEYFSLYQIAAATALKKFPQFLRPSDKIVSVFRKNMNTYMMGASNEGAAPGAIGNGISTAFGEMVERLRTLNELWATPGQATFNANHMRVLPENIEISAGY